MISVGELTKQMVEIPSYKDVGEQELARFIEVFLMTNCPSLDKTIRQTVGGERYNLIMGNTEPNESKILFFCHMDTVDVKPEQTNAGKLIAREESGIIHGLGSVDMKGGTAALLIAFARLKTLPSGLSVFFYCDEEYGFLGMKKIIEKYNLQADIAIFCEPTDLKIADGCRGLIEIHGLVSGKTAHAAKPAGGLNAILLTAKCAELLAHGLSQIKHEKLGLSVCNLAALNGGLGKQTKKGFIIGREGNNVPDVADIVLECRTTSDELNAKKLLRIFRSLVCQGGGKFKLKEIRHDFGLFFTDNDLLTKIEQAVCQATGAALYMDISQSGYYDAQMLAKRFNFPCICLGPGPSETSHKTDERVSVSSLKKLVAIYQNILALY